MIDLTGAADVDSSVTFLDQDVPVASVDGFAATYEAWARWLQSVVPAVRRVRTDAPPLPASADVEPVVTSHVAAAPLAAPLDRTLVPAVVTAPAALHPIAPTHESDPPRHRRRRPAPSAPAWERPAVAAAVPASSSWSRGDPPGVLVAAGTSLATALLDRPPPDARGPDPGARHGVAPVPDPQWPAGAARWTLEG